MKRGLFDKHEAHFVDVAYILLNPPNSGLRGRYRERTSEFYAFTFVRPDIGINAHSGIAYIGSYAKVDVGGSGRETVCKGAYIDSPGMPSFVSCG